MKEFVTPTLDELKEEIRWESEEWLLTLRDFCPFKLNIKNQISDCQN